MPDEAATPDQTISFLGTITNVDLERDMVTVAEERTDGSSASSDDMADAVDCVLTDDTVLIDSQTGGIVGKGDLQGGMRVFAFVSPMMTRSIPPQSHCYALITGVSENNLGLASYVKALEVSTAENGNLVVLNQNADLYITIPVDLQIETLDGPDGSLSDITDGSVFIAWYDVVAESYPGQTTATRVVLCPADGASESASETAADAPSTSPDA